MSEPVVSQEQPRPPRADARRNRERVLSAAARMVSEVGLRAQMSEVAQEAGVGLGTVYRNFPTKASLIAELVARGFDQMATAAGAALKAEKSGWLALDRALQDNLAMLESNPALRDAIVSSRRQDDSAFRAAWLRHQGALGKLIALAQEEGSVRSDVGVADLSALLCGLSASMDSRSYLGWQRHLSVALDALRTPPSHTTLPAPRIDLA